MRNCPQLEPCPLGLSSELNQFSQGRPRLKSAYEAGIQSFGRVGRNRPAGS
jgi:hypothetical protein